MVRLNSREECSSRSWELSGCYIKTFMRYHREQNWFLCVVGFLYWVPVWQPGVGCLERCSVWAWGSWQLAGRGLKAGSHYRWQARQRAAFGTELFPACLCYIQPASKLAFLNFRSLRMKNLNGPMARCDTASAVGVGNHFILVNFIPLAS